MIRIISRVPGMIGSSRRPCFSRKFFTSIPRQNSMKQNSPARGRSEGGGGRRGRRRRGQKPLPVRPDGEYLAQQKARGRYITDTASLITVCDSARDAGVLAFDTEFHLEGTVSLGTSNYYRTGDKIANNKQHPASAKTKPISIAIFISDLESCP